MATTREQITGLLDQLEGEAHRAGAAEQALVDAQELSRVQGQLDAALARVVELEAHEATHHPPPPPPPAPSLLYGASEIRFDQLQAAVGGRLKVRRSYDTTPGPDIMTSRAGVDLRRGIVPWVSFSGLPDDATLEAHFRSVPAGAKVLWTWLHEADMKKTTPTLFRAGYARLRAIRDRAGATGVLLAPVLVGDTFRTGRHVDWLGDGSDLDVVGIDAYRFWRPAGAPGDVDKLGGGLGRDRAMEWLLGQAPAFSQQVGKPIGLGEYGAHPRPEDPSDRPRWLRETDAYLRSIGAFAACYFHSGNGESGPWWVDQYHFTTGGKTAGDPDPDSLDAFAALLG